MISSLNGNNQPSSLKLIFVIYTICILCWLKDFTFKSFLRFYSSLFLRYFASFCHTKFQAVCYGQKFTFFCTLKMWNKIAITKTNSNLFPQTQAGAYAQMMYKFQEIPFKLVRNHHFHFKMVVMLGQGSWKMVNSN